MNIVKQDLQLLKILWSEVWKGGFQLIEILVLLGMYFEAVVVFVTGQILLHRLALAILCTSIQFKMQLQRFRNGREKQSLYKIRGFFLIGIMSFLTILFHKTVKMCPLFITSRFQWFVEVTNFLGFLIALFYENVPNFLYARPIILRLSKDRLTSPKN